MKMTRIEDMASFKYLLENEQDILWGLTVSSVGFQHLEPEVVYPPQNHPTRYFFSTEKGRILNEYQLLYLTRGKGSFLSSSCKQSGIGEGNMFLLFPGEWHVYSPDKETGWDEYWIGFKGVNMDNRCEQGFFSKQKPLFNIGINEEIVHLYKQAISAAKEQKTGFQQLLAGIVNHLLGLVYSLNKHASFEELDVIRQINKAQVIMLETFQEGIPLPEVAQRVSMSYSWFRRIFKQYTGFSPHQYLLELKIQKAKELLTNTHLSVKEIAYRVGFDNLEHFCSVFKMKTQATPVAYRNFTRGKSYSLGHPIPEVVIK
jgi:AraC-like DNA-binding protein